MMAIIRCAVIFKSKELHVSDFTSTLCALTPTLTGVLLTHWWIIFAVVKITQTIRMEKRPSSFETFGNTMFLSGVIISISFSRRLGSQRPSGGSPCSLTSYTIFYSSDSLLCEYESLPQEDKLAKHLATSEFHRLWLIEHNTIALFS